MNVSHRDTRPDVLLSRVPLFSRLSKRSLKRLGKLCVPRSYPRDKVIIEEGGVGLGLFLVTSGKVEIFKGEGDKRVMLAVVGSGDILGEMALIDDQPRSASAVALEPTDCLLITRDSFHTLVKKDPEIAWCIVPTLAERIRQLLKSIDSEDVFDTGDVERIETPSSGSRTEESRSQDDEKSPTEEDNDVDGEEGIAGAVDLLRLQHAVLMAGVTGLTDSVGLWGTFLRCLAEETELGETDELLKVTRRFPGGLITAARSALEEGEKLPERMISSFRRNLKRTSQ